MLSDDPVQGLAEAKDLYERVLAIDSTFAGAWNNLGVLEARAGRLDEAVAHWQRALGVDPGNARALDNLERARQLREQETDNGTGQEGE
jgi:tetratricopeptide (TPR) repeat protein